MARLRDAHSSADREAFERWLAEDAEHRRAYDRALSAYEAAGALRSSELGRRRKLEAVFNRRRTPLARRFATAAVVALLLVGVYQVSPDFNPFRSAAIASVILSTGSEPRVVELADGSSVSMAPSSEVRIDLGRGGRLAEVRKGSARITVRHEKRPFVVIAGASRIDANEGVFDARLNELGGTVVPVADGVGAGSGSAGQGDKDARAMLDFDAEPLATAVARINREQAGPRIEIDGNLARLPVTGVFQEGGTRPSARSLALAFDLDLVETSAGALRLVPKK